MIPMGPTRPGRDVFAPPAYAFLLGDPRWKELKRNVGLPDQ